MRLLLPPVPEHEWQDEVPEGHAGQSLPQMPDAVLWWLWLLLWRCAAAEKQVLGRKVAESQRGTGPLPDNLEKSWQRQD